MDLLIICSMLLLSIQSALSNPRTAQQNQPALGQRGCSCALRTSLYGFQLDRYFDEIPCYFIVVRFPVGINVNFGDELDFEESLGQPTATWPANSNRYYTLISVDVDIPSRQNATGNLFLKWFVTNIRGNDLDSGRTVYSFLRTISRYRVGYHRILFLLYEQTTQVTLSANPEDRECYNSLSEFERDYSLQSPMAANFFTVRFDQYR